MTPEEMDDTTAEVAKAAKQITIFAMILNAALIGGGLYLGYKLVSGK